MINKLSIPIDFIGVGEDVEDLVPFDLDLFASGMNQKKSKIEHIYELSSPSAQIEALENIQVESIWGISKRWGAKLRLIGIGNALQLRNASPQKIRKYLGVVLERIVYELRGVSCLDIDQIQSRKNIMFTRSFGNPINNLTD